MSTIPRWVKPLRAITYSSLLVVVLGRVNLLAGDTTSADAYARFDERTTTWTIGTSMVEEKLQFAKGNYSLSSFQNKLSRRQYVTGSRPSDEFRVTVNGEVYTGTSGGWRWKGGEAKVLAQGEIQWTVRLENDLLRVEKTYVVYPGTSIIRQWTRYENVGSHAIKVGNPSFLSFRV